jgi:hypothetical protein
VADPLSPQGCPWGDGVRSAGIVKHEQRPWSSARSPGKEVAAMVGLSDCRITGECRDRWMSGGECEHSHYWERLLTAAFMTTATAWVVR